MSPSTLYEINIQNPDERTFAAIASSEIMDNQGEIVPVNEILKTMPRYVERGGAITWQHSNKIVGRLISFAPVDVDGNKSIEIVCKIYNDNELDSEVWKKILDQEIKGVSIGGLAEDDGSIHIVEISVVEKPANPKAVILAHSIAKSEISKTIERRGDKWVVLTEDKSKVLGTHDTKEEALRQLRAIEAQKNKSETEKQDERPPKQWWDRCTARAEGFATDEAKFCGALWFNPEDFPGGTKLRESFGKGEQVADEDVKKAVNSFITKGDDTVKGTELKKQEETPEAPPEEKPAEEPVEKQPEEEQKPEGEVEKQEGPNLEDRVAKLEEMIAAILSKLEAAAPEEETEKQEEDEEEEDMVEKTATKAAEKTIELLQKSSIKQTIANKPTQFIEKASKPKGFIEKHQDKFDDFFKTGVMAEEVKEEVNRVDQIKQLEADLAVARKLKEVN